MGGYIFLGTGLAESEYQGALGSGKVFQDHLYTPSLAPCVASLVTHVIMDPLHSLRKVPCSLLLLTNSQIAMAVAIININSPWLNWIITG